MDILFCGKLEELYRFANIVNEPDLFILLNLISKGPMNSALLSSLTTLSEEQIKKILDKSCKDGLVECVEKGKSKVFVPRYIMKMEEFNELDELAKKVGEGMRRLLRRSISENDETIMKVFESKGGEYSLGSLISQLTLKSLNFFFEGLREELKEEAKSVAKELSKKKS
ncbi:MAG: hypothetical protein QXH58_04720 [Nitrososphaerales archaeon]